MTNEIQFKQEALYGRLESDILSGKYAEGVQLPKEVDFSKTLGVARGTLRNALNTLESKGLIVRLRSRGTFVKPRYAQSDIKRILILLDMSQKNDITCASNYIIPGIESVAKNAAKTEIWPLQLLNEMDLDSGIKFLNNAFIDGTVIFGGCYSGNENYIRMLQEFRKPVVMANSYPGDTAVTGFASVRTESRGAWNAGITYLKSKGHQRIATITYPLMRGYESLDLYCEFLESEGVYYSGFIKIAQNDYESIKTAFLSLMSMEHTPTAIMCYSDFYAIHLLKAVREYGIKIPENLAVMGYCGFPGSAYLDPPLSTVDYHYFKIGETIMEMLKKSDEWFNVKHVSPPDILYPYEVIERTSTQTLRIEGAFV